MLSTSPSSGACGRDQKGVPDADQRIQCLISDPHFAGSAFVRVLAVGAREVRLDAEAGTPGRLPVRTGLVFDRREHEAYRHFAGSAEETPARDR